MANHIVAFCGNFPTISYGGYDVSFNVYLTVGVFETEMASLCALVYVVLLGVELFLQLVLFSSCSSCGEGVIAESGSGFGKVILRAVE